MEKYIGVKLIEAKPMTLGEYNVYRGWTIPPDEDKGKEGYLVKYSDDYESWSPKDVFDAAYLKVDGDGTKITEQMVEDFVDSETTTKLGEKTTVVQMGLRSGFVVTESSSCVDPANYNEDRGAELAADKIKGKVWSLLGFVLQWAKYGLK